MQRVHLVELEDLAWVPRAVRDGATDVLDYLFARVHFYRPLVDVFTKALAATGARTVVDLCSGGGGGALYLAHVLRERGQTDVRFVLTDLHPNEAARERIGSEQGLAYHPTPVDAMAVPAELRGLRTMFSALHHFRPDQVKALLASAVAARSHVAFFDGGSSPALRRVPLLLIPVGAMVNATFLLLVPLFVVPFVRPLRASRWLLTYLLPLVPILFAWDGTVSALRVYAPEELLEIARSVPGGDSYIWEAGRGGQALYLTGRPR
ncbi:MAG: hypothetical protein SFX73_03935 [Kofleriaceae bacterium]|nr:hypothetical protein [Kofleriaceae bacterium]